MCAVATERSGVQGRRGFLKTTLALTAWALAGRTRAGLAAWTAPLAEPQLWHGVRVFPRNAWSWCDPRPRLLRPADEFHRLTVHHAGNRVNTNTGWDTVVRDLNGVLDAHLKNRFGDIAYHFIIDYSGRIWQGRALCHRGAHVYGENAHNLGIMLQGNFEDQRPSAAQVGALLDLIRAARSAWRIPGAAVYGHRDLGRSICPGRFLYEMLDCAKV